MSERIIRVLLIEEDTANARRIREKVAAIQREGWTLPHLEVEHVDDVGRALAHLETETFDAALIDLDLPDGQPERAVALLREQIPQTPLVALVGEQTVPTGVHDTLHKHRASGGLIARALLYALERQKTRERLAEQAAERTNKLHQLQAEIAERKRAEQALAEQTCALQASRERYRSLFTEFPISIWEEDFAEVKTYLDKLRAAGITDFAAHFQEHPEDVVHCLGLVRVLDINKAALTLRGAERKADFSKGLDAFLSEDAYAGFAEELVQIAEGATRIEIDAVDRTSQGERRHLAVTWQVAPGHEESLSRCLVAVRDITERKRTEEALARKTEALQASESRVRQKLDSILSPNGDLDQLELVDIIDVEAIQALMDEFYALTNIGIAILDLDGEILVATGWQDICTQFHRVHPETRQHCTESDTELTAGAEPGTYKRYKCKNQMWDIATPIVIGGRHLGNLFLGQFFFEDESVDRERFRRQAQKYGFDEDAYLDALDRVPRWSREKVDTAFRFYIRLAEMISDLSHSNLKLAQALSEKEQLLAAHKESEQKFKSYIEHAPYGIFVTNQDGQYLDVNEAACRLTGYSRDELLRLQMTEIAPPDQRDLIRQHFQMAAEQGICTSEKPFVTREGRTRWWSVTTVRLSETRFLSYKEDVTARKQAREARQINKLRMQALLELSRMREASIEEIADFVLAQAIQLTKSELGFLGFIDEKSAEMTLHAWSEKAMRLCQLDTQPGQFSFDDAGVWAEAIRQRRPLMLNTYAAPHPAKKGCPEGHVPLTRLLSVPVHQGEEIEAIVAVANKETEYHETDVQQIQLLTDGMMHLIGERRAAEVLRESEKKFRTLVENVVDWVWQVDERGTYTYVSPQAEKIMGYSAAEILGKTLFDFMTPQEAERVGAIFSNVMSRQERILGLEDTMIAKDGREILFETNATPLLDAQGEFMGYMGTCRDVTERKRAEQALRESERQKELILNATAEMVAYYDTDLRIIWANRAAAESVGRTPEEMVGAYCYEIWHERDEPCPDCPVVQARDAQTPWQGEQQTPDGRYWSVRGYPVFDEDREGNEVVALVEFGQDITERKRTEAKIARYAADLKRSNDELQRFAYVVSHDLQAPLRTVKGYLKLLTEDYEHRLDERADLYIRYVMEGAERMQAMISALLDLSRVETRGHAFIPTDCEHVVQHVLEDLALVIAENDATVTHDPLPTVMADRAQLARVFQNLVANAIKFRREDVAPRAHISAEREDDTWTFSIADNGIGIDPAHADRIFQIFQRLHTDEEYPGLGIGLALSKRIVERHGGRIWVESTPGAGSTFYFTMQAITDDGQWTPTER